MYIATTTLAAGLGGIATLAAVVVEMITVMVVATMGEERGSMGSIEGGILIGDGTGRRRGEGRVRMVDGTRKMTMRMVLLGFGGIGGAVGGMMRPGVV